jgi:hypothetical protein
VPVYLHVVTVDRMMETIIGYVTQVSVLQTLTGIQSHFPTGVILELCFNRTFTHLCSCRDPSVVPAYRLNIGYRPFVSVWRAKT